jgi:hypothetical protein
MTMTAKQANTILQAFIASEEMDNAARYLQAGRRLARLSDAALKALWADAWRRYCDEHWAERWTDCIDTDAELTLRRLPRPEHLIPAESWKRVIALSREVARRPNINQRLGEDIEDFVRQSAARRN